jgi:hypothetical protein
MEQTKKYPEFPENKYKKLERIIKELKEIVAQENKLHPMDQDLTPSMLALLEEEIIPVLENELDYDPTPQYLYDNTGGEPPMTAAETHHAAWVQHQELHR